MSIEWKTSKGRLFCGTRPQPTADTEPGPSLPIIRERMPSIKQTLMGYSNRVLVTRRRNNAMRSTGCVNVPVVCPTSYWMAVSELRQIQTHRRPDNFRFGNSHADQSAFRLVARRGGAWQEVLRHVIN